MTRQIRIAFVIDSLGIGGSERQFVELVKRIDRARYDPVAICLSRGGDLLKEVRNLLTLTVERRGKAGFSSIWQMARLMKAQKVEIVQSYLWLANFHARAAAKLAGVPVVVSGVRGIEYTTATWKGRLRWAADRVLARTTGAIVVNSEAMRRHLTENGFDAAKVQVIYNGVDSIGPDETFDVGRAKESLGLSPIDPAVGISARLEPVKDHRTFLLAARSILDVFPKTRFVLLGDGPLRGTLEQFADELNIRSSVIFAGMVSNGIGKALAALDVSVLCSKHESFPNAILESMALGKPVVATAVGGCPELVVDGETGILVSSQDAAQLAEAVIRLLRDRELAKKMGEQGQQRVKQHFGIGRMVQDYERLYADLLQERQLLHPTA